MPTPLYVIKALTEVRDGALANMLDRDAVEMLVTNQRAAEWISKAADSEYMGALNDMGAAESDDFMGADTRTAAMIDDDEDFPGVEIDPISGLPEHLFRNDDESAPDTGAMAAGEAEKTAALEEEGRKLAVKQSWDGYNILVIAQAALTDANFHREAEVIGRMIQALDDMVDPRYVLEVSEAE